MSRIQDYIKFSQFNGLVFASPTLIWRQSQGMWPSKMNLSIEVKDGQRHFSSLAERMKHMEIMVDGDWHEVYAFSVSKLSERINHLTGLKVTEIREFGAVKEESEVEVEQPKDNAPGFNLKQFQAELKEKQRQQVQDEMKRDREKREQGQRQSRAVKSRA